MKAVIGIDQGDPLPGLYDIIRIDHSHPRCYGRTITRKQFFSCRIGRPARTIAGANISKPHTIISGAVLRNAALVKNSVGQACTAIETVYFKDGHKGDAVDGTE